MNFLIQCQSFWFVYWYISFLFYFFELRYYSFILFNLNFDLLFLMLILFCLEFITNSDQKSLLLLRGLGYGLLIFLTLIIEYLPKIIYCFSSEEALESTNSLTNDISKSKSLINKTATTMTQTRTRSVVTLNSHKDPLKRKY